MKTKTSGSGLIFAVVLLFVILGMVITLSSVTVLETKMSQKTKSSIGAFYNSESGVEWALNQISIKDGTAQISTIGACPFTGCSVLFLDKDGKVLASSSTIDQVKAVRSVGTQGGETQRAIEAAVASQCGFGARVTYLYSASTSYQQASSDGIITVNGFAGGPTGSIGLYIGDSATPSNPIISGGDVDSSRADSISAFIKKNEYWKVVSGGDSAYDNATLIYWVPFTCN